MAGISGPLKITRNGRQRVDVRRPFRRGLIALPPAHGPSTGSFTVCRPGESARVTPFTYFSSHSTRLLAASTLRTVLGTRNLAEILSERETISHTMQTALDEATDPWGVKVERVEM